MTKPKRVGYGRECSTYRACPVLPSIVLLILNVIAKNHASSENEPANGDNVADTARETVPIRIRQIHRIVPRIRIAVRPHPRPGHLPPVRLDEPAEHRVVGAGVEVLEADLGVEARADPAHRRLGRGEHRLQPGAGVLGRAGAKPPEGRVRRTEWMSGLRLGRSWSNLGARRPARAGERRPASGAARSPLVS